jgi:hypothetical protein
MILAVAPAHALVLTVSHCLAFGHPFIKAVDPLDAYELSIARKDARNARTGIAAVRSLLHSHPDAARKRRAAPALNCP